MIEIIMVKVVIQIDIDQTARIEEHHSEVDVSMDRIIEEDNDMLIITEMDFRRDNFRDMQGYRGQNVRGGYRKNYRNVNFGRCRSRSRERQYSGNSNSSDRSSNRLRSGLRASTNRDRIRCFKCREYDYFAKECPDSQTRTNKTNV